MKRGPTLSAPVLLINPKFTFESFILKFVAYY